MAPSPHGRMLPTHLRTSFWSPKGHRDKQREELGSATEVEEKHKNKAAMQSYNPKEMPTSHSQKASDPTRHQG